MLRADSALRAADWVTFGKVWDSLRKSFGIGPDSVSADELARPRSRD